MKLTDDVLAEVHAKADASVPEQEWSITSAEMLVLIAEIERLRRAVVLMCPARDGFNEHFEALRSLGIIVKIPSDAAFREEWGDEPFMYVFAWDERASRKEADRG